MLGVEVAERGLRVKRFFVESSEAGLPITIKLKSRSGKSITARATEMDSLRYVRDRWRIQHTFRRACKRRAALAIAVAISLDKLSSKPLDFPAFQQIRQNFRPRLSKLRREGATTINMEDDNTSKRNNSDVVHSGFGGSVAHEPDDPEESKAAIVCPKPSGKAKSS